MWPLPEMLVYREADEKINEWKSPLVITHDVDTRFGFEQIRAVADVERRLGLRGSWNIVPALYEIDGAVLEYLRGAAAEIGVHDWKHDGRLFSDKKIFDERVKKINRVIKEWDAKGFRAGMAFHHDEWMQELVCEYDSSYYDSDPYQLMGGGCAEIRPFMLGHLVELPYTMPQDHVLFVAGAALKVPRVWDGEDDGRKRNWEWISRYLERDPQITQISTDNFVSRKGAKARRVKMVSHGGHREFRGADYLRGVDIWKMKAEWLMEQGGMVLMITHPDYLCHPKLVKRKEERGKRKQIYDGWLGEDDRDVVEVREKGIIEEKWFGSLLEQYAAFLNWFKKEFEGRYWRGLPWELAKRFRDREQLSKESAKMRR